VVLEDGGVSCGLLGARVNKGGGEARAEMTATWLKDGELARTKKVSVPSCLSR